MFDVNVAILTILEKNTGITAHNITMKINSSEIDVVLSREDVSKSLQSLKRKGLVSNKCNVWNNNYD